jgi:hypothetical protein
MSKWIKLIVALVLLPVAAAEALTLARVVAACGSADTTWVPLLAGMACWLVIFLLLPKPMWIYVFGHELTHALWTWLFGGRVKQMKVSAKGGHVVVDKNNFVIVLAPYFFPLYAALVVLLFGVGNWIWDWRGYLVWFDLALGAAYAFHVTLTWHVLQMQQSDITSQGWIFSAVIIFMGNVSVLLGGLPLITGQPRLTQALGWWWTDLATIWHGLAAGGKWAFLKMLTIHS